MNGNIRLAIDRLVLLAIVVAAWQACSLQFGMHWFSSPWRAVERFWELSLNGDLLYHAEYTVGAAVCGFLIGGIPGTLLPFLLRRHPVVNAVLDPYFAGGYGVPKLALAP